MNLTSTNTIISAPNQTVYARSAPCNHTPFCYGIKSNRISLGIPSLCIIFLLLIIFITAFLMGCAVHVSYEMHSRITPEQNMSNEHTQFIEVRAKTYVPSTNSFESTTTASCGKCDEAFVHPGMISHPNPTVKPQNIHCQTFILFCNESLT